MPMRPAAQSDLDRVVVSARNALYKDLRKYTAGTIDREELSQRLDETLTGKYSRAAFLGRHRAGDNSPYNEDDIRFGRSVQDGQSQFFDRWMDQIDAGKYGDHNNGFDEEGLFDRADMYADRCTGVANETWALTLDEDTLVYWQMYKLERHCSECPAFQEGSPYRADDLPAYPRDGTTPCVMNCGCGLRYINDAGRDVRGFQGTDD